MAIIYMLELLKKNPMVTNFVDEDIIMIDMTLLDESVIDIMIIDSCAPLSLVSRGWIDLST